MNSLDLLDTLEFEDQLALHQNINPVSTIELDILVVHRLWVLQLECDSIAVQLVRQALFVGRFEQSRAQMTVNLNGAANHTIGKIVEFPLRALRVLRGEADLLQKPRDAERLR